MSVLPKKNDSNRVFYLDYLRVFIVFLVIVLHSLLPFVVGFDWKINDVIKTYPFTYASSVIDVFIMPIMFFIAGYFAFPSIRKGVKNFINSKITRIALPFAFGIMFLAPIISYLGLLHHKVIDLSYMAYWTYVYFNYPIDFQHYWFLSSLFLFFMLFAVVYVLMKGKLEKIYEDSKTHQPSNRSIVLFLLAFVILAAGLFFGACRIFSDGPWYSILYFFPVQVTRWTGYVLYFCLGVIAYIKRIDLTGRLRKHALWLTASLIPLTYFYIDFRFRFYYSADQGFLKPDIQFYNSIIHVIYCMMIFLALTALFGYLNRPSKIFQRLAKDSFTIYIVHMVYTVLIQFYIMNQKLDIFVKFIIILIGTIVLSIATAELISLVGSFFKKINVRKE